MGNYSETCIQQENGLYIRQEFIKAIRGIPHKKATKIFDFQII